MFTDKDSKYREKKLVVTALEKATEKSLSKAGQILSGIVSNLSAYPEFDKDAIISKRNKDQLKTANSIIESAASCIRGLRYGGGIATIQLLTAITAIFMPQQNSTEEESSSSFRSFFRLLGLNRMAKYVKEGIMNRKLFNEYMKLKGTIKVNGRVNC